MSNEKPNFETTPFGVPEHLQDAMERISSATPEELQHAGEDAAEKPSLDTEAVKQDKDRVKDLRDQVFQQVQSNPQAQTDDTLGATPEPSTDKKGSIEWLIDIPEEQRVEKSMQLIESKGKDVIEVIDAFLRAGDLHNLDNLERELAENMDRLVQKGVIPELKK
jgi:hypothetical protein